MSFFKSSISLVGGTLKRIYWLVPTLFLDPFDLAERYFDVTYEVPQWLMWSLGAGGLFVAVSLTYHELRKQKEGLEAQLGKETDTFHMEFNGYSMLTRDDRVLQLGVIFHSDVDVIVDELALQVGGNLLQPSDWKPFKLKRIHNKNYTFVPATVREAAGSDYGEAKLVVRVGSKQYESEPFKIDGLL